MQNKITYFLNGNVNKTGNDVILMMQQTHKCESRLLYQILSFLWQDKV